MSAELLTCPREGAVSLADVTVVVVTHESAHCLDALSPLLSKCPNVIVVDNGSTDDTARRAGRLWLHARVVALERNLGFGAANNRALAQVSTPFALLLNPDCEFPQSDLLELLQVAEQWPEAALLAPQLASPSGALEVNYRWPSTLWRPAGPAATGPLCVGFVCGAAMLFRMQRFESVGFFDERFFLYYEDDDLCLRLFQAGLPMVVVPQCRAVHRSRGSSRGSTPWRNEYRRGFHHAQSKLFFTAKHRSLQEAAELRRRLLLSTSFAFPFRMVLFAPRLIARMAGRWMGLKNWRVDG
ncbi:MAG: glycosyltransferase family 2 protein [Hydrogenophaga sp.]